MLRPYNCSGPCTSVYSGIVIVVALVVVLMLFIS